MIEQVDLVGSWTLVSIEVIGENPHGRPAPFGRKPQGVLHYTAEGRMAAILQDGERPPMPRGRQGASDAELAETVRGFSAYAGTFEILPGRIVHHVDFNSYPNDVGTDYERVAHFDRDLLILETPPDQPAGGMDLRLVWRRIAA